MSKGVAGQIGSSKSSGGSAAVTGGVSGSEGVAESPDDPSSSGSRGQRRRRRRHHHHHNRNLQKRSSKGFEFAFVTLLAMAILLWILYTLLPRAEKHRNNDEESHLGPHIRLSLHSLTG